MEYKNILVSFGNASIDGHVLDAALGMAEKFSAKLTLLHVNEQGAGAGAGYGFVQYDHRFTQEELEAIVKEKNIKGLKTEVKLITNAPIMKTIVSEAQNTDLLVIGHCHMGMIEEAISDSIDEMVINRVECHVLVIKED